MLSEETDTTLKSAWWIWSLSIKRRREIVTSRPLVLLSFCITEFIMLNKVHFSPQVLWLATLVESPVIRQKQCGESLAVSADPWGAWVMTSVVLVDTGGTVVEYVTADEDSQQVGWT